MAEEYGKIVDKQISGADLKSLVGKLIAGKVSRDEKAARDPRDTGPGSPLYRSRVWRIGDGSAFPQ